MKKKLFILLLSIISAICLAVGLSACGGNSENSSGNSEHEHSLVYYSAVDATETEDGHKEYWYCAGCGKYFSDTEGNNEIDVNSIIIAALGENTTYTITFIADNNIISEVSYSNGDTNIEIPEVPVKYGYEGVWSDFELYTANITVVAVYTPVDCYVNYENTKGAYNSNVSLYTIENGITLNDLYLDGYTFNGWYTEDGEKITEISYNNYSSGITLIADWLLIEYTATFVDENGDTVDTRTYTVETEYISVPEVPDKSGYAGAWGSYSLVANDIIITPVYTLNAYTATFVDENGNAIYYSTYTIESDSIYEPSVPYKRYYTGVWENYSLEIGGVIISPVYTAINYVVRFVNENYEVVGTANYTIETTEIDEPEVPSKPGYTGEWESYTFTYGNSITVKALYTTEGATEGLVYGEYTDDGLSYCYVSGYTGSDNEVFIPSIYRNRQVTEIQSNAFSSNLEITKVTIDYGISYIGYSAFSGCTSLTDISIPDSVTTIEDYAFNECASLITITIPDSVTAIGSYTFHGCASLKSIVIPDSVSCVAWGLFSDCISLENLTIPCVGANNSGTGSELLGHIFGYSSAQTDYDKCIVIGQKGSTGTSYFSIPKSLKSVTVTGGDISYGAFSNLSMLTNITLGEDITEISEYAFYNCTNLANITLSTEATVIGSYAFYGCTNLTSLSLGDKITTIGSYVFYNCSSLTDINLSDNLTSLGNYTFYNCTSLSYNIYENGYYLGNDNNKYLVIIDVIDTSKSTFSINENTRFIYDYAFYDCSLLENITLTDNILSIGVYSFASCTSLKSIEIPSSVLSISGWAFFNCSGLTSIDISATITFIGDYTFYGCCELENINIPSSVTSIGSYAFYNCYGLTNIEIPNGVVSIGDEAFRYCTALESVTISDSVTTVGKMAFRGCTSLKNVVLGKGLTSISDYMFYQCYSLENINIPDNIVTINEYAFYDCSSLNSICLPDGLESIGLSAFYNCSSLTNIEIPTSVTTLYANAFYNCIMLTNMILPESVIFIGNSVFEGCSSLTSVTLPETLTSIGIQLFYGCTSLESISIPDSVLSIGSSAFRGCSSLTNVIIPENVTSIGNYAFRDCDSLESVEIGGSVTTIGISAFENCSSLVSLIVGSSVDTIGSEAFLRCYKLVEIYNLSSLELIAGSTNYGLIGYYAININTSLETESGLFSQGDYLFYNDDGSFYLVMYKGSDNILELPDLIVDDESVNYSINNYAFYANLTLYSIKIPSGIVDIGEYAFYECSNLLEIYNFSSLSIELGKTNNGFIAYYAKSVYTLDSIESSVFVQGDFTFYNDNGIYYLLSYKGNDSTVILPELIIDGESIIYYIYSYAFYNNTTLTNITIQNVGNHIYEYAFYGCTSLECVIIDDCITSIGYQAFSNCSSLKYITLPKSLTFINNFAFLNCDSLEIVYINDLDAWCNITFENQTANPMSFANYLYLNEKIISGDIVLSDDITKIPIGTFKNSNISSITISNSVTSIGEYAFYNCILLTSIKIPEQVALIGNYTFANCASLEYLVISENLTSVAAYSFRNCTSLKYIYYKGTEEEWNNIYINNSNNGNANGTFISATRYYYAENDGTVTDAGSYWYYDSDNNIVTWIIEDTSGETSD